MNVKMPICGWIVGVAIVATIGCSPSPRGISLDHRNINSLSPRPSQTGSEIADLSRYRGQTSFLNPITWSYGRGGFPMPSQTEQSSDKGGRTEQEADVFKIGKPGSKLLFLLNNYRGLQVVSYVDGPDAPRLLGRVAPTGHYPREMYHDAHQDRLVVIENVYTPETESQWWRPTQREAFSRLVIYDVSKPENPRLDQVLDLKGLVADSRMVGEVLYVATSQGEKGFVTSYLLKKSGLQIVDSHELGLRVSYAQNMNIVTVSNGGDYKYYLLATLSESGWGWWDRSSQVEVIDISDAKGGVRPIMTVAAKGRVGERSQTMVKNDTLIVTSNYSIESSGRDVARIAVETFRFPTAASEVLDENEAMYRKLHIDRELKGLSGSEYEERRTRLIQDEKIGIQGRFVKVGAELRKMMPDSVVTVGDSTGLSANLQDVRYDGDLLYAFWVPANQIDPFDLFDISHPEEGVKYLSRLQFDGWIQRAIPMSIDGRRFVLGLGWIVPVVGNESARRQPQAMIFEIIDVGGRLRAVDVAQLTFTGSNIWTDFNGQDKMLDVRMDEAGRGEVLFAASRWEAAGGYQDGGQLLSFDVSAIVKGRPEQALQKGAFLSGGQDWIRRVFTNPEVGRINSFSDRHLATFGPKVEGHVSTLSPIHLLELARNMVGYETLKINGQTIGVQIISEYGWYTSTSETELRVVHTRRADSEKAAAVSTLQVEGRYIDHLVDGRSGDLWLLSEKYERVQSANGGFDYRRSILLSKIGANARGKIRLLAQTQWLSDKQDKFVYPIGSSLRLGYGNVDNESLLQLKDGSLLAQVNSHIHLIDSRVGLGVQPLSLSSCAGTDRYDVNVRTFGDQLFVTSKERVLSRDFEGLEFARHFMASASLQGGDLVCGREINIPGRLVQVTREGALLVDDTWVEDIVPTTRVGDAHLAREGFESLTRDSLVSLKLQNGQAVLVDEQEKTPSKLRLEPLPNGAFVNLVKARGWGSSTHELQFLSLAPDATLQMETFAFKTDVGSEVYIEGLAALPGEGGQMVALIRSGSRLQAITWSEKEKRPVLKKLVALNEKMEKQTPADMIRLPANAYSWGTRAVHFSSDQLSFELIQGLSGIQQIFLSDDASNDERGVVVSAESLVSRLPGAVQE